MCDRVVSEDSFMIIYSPCKYKTQNMCDEAVDNCLVALKFITGRFVTSKILERSHDALLTNDDILFSDEDFSKVTFFLMKWVFIFNADFDEINLDNDKDFDKGDPETIIHIELLTWHNKFEKPKTLKKDTSKELMPVVWHSTR